MDIGSNMPTHDIAGRLTDHGKDVEIERLRHDLESMQEIARERPDASIHIDVPVGGSARARVTFPGGGFAIVKAGEAIRVWPAYNTRPEAPPMQQGKVSDRG